MNRILIYSLLTLMITAIITACGSGTKEDSSHTVHNYTCPMHPQIVQEGAGSCPICGMDLVPAGETGQRPEITLSERQMKLAGISVAKISSGSIGNNTFLTGRLSADQELSSMISSRVAGRIERLYIKQTGAPVRKGQPLYTIYSEELLTLQKEYLLTLAQYRQLGQGEDRYASFMEAAKKKLLLYGMTVSQVEDLAKTEVFSPEVTFLSPTTGIVTEVQASEGQYVTQGARLYQIDGLARLWVEAELYPREAALVQPGEQVQVIVNGYTNAPLEGEVVFVSPEYQRGTQLLTLRAAIPNPEGVLVPGMQARVVLRKDSRQALVLPSRAVIRGENGAHVWVKTGEGTFMPRKVTTGPETFDKTAITAGLKEGEPVVISGAYLLYSELVLKKGIDPTSMNM